MKALIFVKKSSRFPGKHLADICGERMIDRIVRIIDQSNLFDEIIIITKDASIKSEKARIVADKNPGILIDSIIDSIERFGEFFAIAGDMPLVDENLLREMMKNYDGNPLTSITHRGDVQPLLAIYNRTILEDFLDFAKTSSAIYPFVEERFKKFEVNETEEWKLNNVNLPDDIMKVKRILRC